MIKSAIKLLESNPKTPSTITQFRAALVAGFDCTCTLDSEELEQLNWPSTNARNVSQHLNRPKGIADSVSLVNCACSDRSQQIATHDGYSTLTAAIKKESAKSIERYSQYENHLIFFFSGHGVTTTEDDKPWSEVLLMNHSPELSGIKLFTLDEIQKHLAEHGAFSSAVYILDSCSTFFPAPAEKRRYPNAPRAAAIKPTKPGFPLPDDGKFSKAVGLAFSSIHTRSFGNSITLKQLKCAINDAWQPLVYCPTIFLENPIHDQDVIWKLPSKGMIRAEFEVLAPDADSQLKSIPNQITRPLSRKSMWRCWKVGGSLRWKGLKAGPTTSSYEIPVESLFPWLILGSISQPPNILSHDSKKYYRG